MGFSREIKDEVMVKSARRCCVCNEYKGVCVEVHHIIPKSEGGSDSIENAIALCFDCHCAVGHYNNKHPKGTKFSRNELLRHRDEWYEKVKNNVHVINVDRFCGKYLVRHIVCFDVDVVYDLIKFKKDDIPFNYNYIMKNKIYKIFCDIVSDWKIDCYSCYMHEDGYFSCDSVYEELKEKFGDVVEESDHVGRSLTFDDFKRGLVPSRFINELVLSGFPAEDMGDVFAFYHGCWDSVVCYVETRKPYFVFLEFKNLSDENMKLSDIILGRHDVDKKYYKASDKIDKNIIREDCGNLVLEHGESVLIPEGVLLSSGGYNNFCRDYEICKYNYAHRERCNILGYQSDCDFSNYYFINPFDFVLGVDVEVGQCHHFLPVHDFITSKCYTFNRAWMCGSCPYVYLYDYLNKKWKYLKEIFCMSHCIEEIYECINVPNWCSIVRFVEIDYEKTSISSVRINGFEVIQEDLCFERGVFADFKVSGGDVVEVKGRYDAVIMSPKNFDQIRQKYSLLREYEKVCLK